MVWGIWQYSNLYLFCGKRGTVYDCVWQGREGLCIWSNRMVMMLMNAEVLIIHLGAVHHSFSFQRSRYCICMRVDCQWIMSIFLNPMGTSCEAQGRLDKTRKDAWMNKNVEEKRTEFAGCGAKDVNDCNDGCRLRWSHTHPETSWQCPRNK